MTQIKQAAVAPASAAFYLLFIAFASLGLGLLGLPLYSKSFVPAASAALATLSGFLAGYPEAVHGTLLQATPGGFFLQVEPRCLAVELFLVFSAAVLAFPAPFAVRMRGMLLGLVFTALLNALRIAINFRLGLWSAATGDMAIYVLSTLNLTALIALFLFWARPSGIARLTRAELVFWGAALALLAISHDLWLAFGWGFISILPPGITRLLLDALSLGYIGDVSILPSQADVGWMFFVPAFSPTVDGDVFQPTIPFDNISLFLFPLVSFALCQSLLGPQRWQWRPWLTGLAGGVLWYGLGLIFMAVHINSIAAMHAPSPFFPHIEPPPFFLIAPPNLSALFYGSGWMYEVFFVLSNVAGFALWAGLAARNRYAARAGG